MEGFGFYDLGDLGFDFFDGAEVDLVDHLGCGALGAGDDFEGVAFEEVELDDEFFPFGEFEEGEDLRIVYECEEVVFGEEAHVFWFWFFWNLGHKEHEEGTRNTKLFSSSF